MREEAAVFKIGIGTAAMPAASCRLQRRASFRRAKDAITPLVAASRLPVSLRGKAFGAAAEAIEGFEEA